MRARGATLVIAAGVLAGALAVAAWFGYYAIWLPRRLVREFVAVAARGELDAMRARIVPEHRGAYDDVRLRLVSDELRHHDRVEWLRSGLGTMREGGRTCGASARLHDPVSGERELEASFIQVEGVWYLDAFSLGDRARARARDKTVAVDPP